MHINLLNLHLIFFFNDWLVRICTNTCTNQFKDVNCFRLFVLFIFFLRLLVYTPETIQCILPSVQSHILIRMPRPSRSECLFPVSLSLYPECGSVGRSQGIWYPQSLSLTAKSRVLYNRNARFSTTCYRISCMCTCGIIKKLSCTRI